MKFKFLNVALVGVVLTVSSFANATLIKFTYESVSFDTISSEIDVNDPLFLTTDTISGSILVQIDGELKYNTQYDIASSLYVLDVLDVLEYDFEAGGIRIKSSVPDGTERFTFLIDAGGAVQFSSIYIGNGKFEEIGDEQSFINVVSAKYAVAERKRCLGLNPRGGYCEFFDRSSKAVALSRVSLERSRPVGYWSFAEVPEPSTLAIFALGMIGLALRRFKK